MIKIGLVGEDPNDTSSIKNLLQKRYRKRITFYPLVSRIKGYHLDNPKIRRSLPIEFSDKKCKFVIYIRDLDGFKTDHSKIKSRQNWFKEIDKVVNNKGILLLNIWELEALILADIATFNKLYKTSYKYTGDPMVQKEPKEELMRATLKTKRQYKESDCPEIFEKLDFNIVEKKCAYFMQFHKEFKSRLK
jgi:hypothetical protein